MEIKQKITRKLGLSMGVYGSGFRQKRCTCLGDPYNKVNPIFRGSILGSPNLWKLLLGKLLQAGSMLDIRPIWSHILSEEDLKDFALHAMLGSKTSCVMLEVLPWLSRKIESLATAGAGGE